jgi:teichuronic acid biosynthesis glycosyltransferase TuaG
MAKKAERSDAFAGGGVFAPAPGNVFRAGDGSGPSVSVVIPAYECAGFIESTVQSVLGQVYQPFEVLVVVDPSLDGTEKAVARLAENNPQVTPVYNKKALGLAGSRNLGILLAKGEYIAFLDADDLWLPEKLGRQMEIMRKNGDYALCCTSYVFMSPSGQPIARSYHVDGPIGFRDMLRENKIGTSTCLLKSEVAKMYQMDDSYFHEDYVYWLSIMRDGHLAYGIDEPLMRYRILPKSRSRNKILTARHRWMVYRRFMCMNLFESLYYWAWYAVRALRKYSRREMRSA